MDETRSESVILNAQIRGERTIAKARFILIAILAAIAVYVFLSAVAERGLAVEIFRPVYYIEITCLALCATVSALVFRVTGTGSYRAWMRVLPSLVDVTCIAAIHWGMATTNNPSYSFTGATVWLYVLFIALSSLRNSPKSVAITGLYAVTAFLAINISSFAGMGNFNPGENVYTNALGRVVKLDFEDEVIKATIILAVTFILSMASKRNQDLLQRRIELQLMSEKYAETLKRINESLERFIPREFLGFLGKDNILEVSLGDWTERKMTIFFLDIRDFTALSETLSPQENFRFLNSFLGIFGPIIRKHGGFVDKYPGDGIMALFPGEADAALDAAIEMRDRLLEYNEGRARCGYVPIKFGIGIHSGPIMLGTIGESHRMDSTVISDAVNTASRLEGLTKKFSACVLVSGATMESLSRPERFETRYIAGEKVKGKANVVQVFELTGRVI